MRPEHKAANQLLDIAATGDREAYQARIAEIRKELPEQVAQRAVELAAWQYRVYSRYYRLFGWRASWMHGERG